MASALKRTNSRCDLGRLRVPPSEVTMFREQVENVCDTGRVVAPTADKFRELLMSKTFTNATTDPSLVLGLYQGFLREGFGAARRLTYGSLGWVDAEMALLAQVHMACILFGALRTLSLP